VYDALPGRSLLTWPDYVVVGVLLSSMLLVGAWFEKRQTSTREFFLGSRSVPSWAACLSFVATEVSAVTIISVPATAFVENWVPAVLRRLGRGQAVIALFIPVLSIRMHHHLSVPGVRFGRLTQTTASLLSHAAFGSGVRLMAACAMSVLLGAHLPAIVLIVVSTAALGGMRAVI
jgi:Na+/proline symporter